MPPPLYSVSTASPACRSTATCADTTTGRPVVVDPQRDISEYLADAFTIAAIAGVLTGGKVADRLDPERSLRWFVGPLGRMPFAERDVQP